MGSTRTTPPTTEGEPTDGPTPGDGIPATVDGPTPAEATPAVNPPATPTEQDVAEAEAAAGGESVDLALRQHWTDADGKPYAPGETVTVDATTAVTLTNAQWADKADATGDAPA